MEPYSGLKGKASKRFAGSNIKNNHQKEGGRASCFLKLLDYNLSGPERSINMAGDSLAFHFMVKEKKLLSVFVDESGDDGFGKEGSSEFYIFTMVFS